MTAYQLQKDMAQEIKATLSDMLFQDAKGTQVLFGKLNDAFSVTLNVAILC